MKYFLAVVSVGLILGLLIFFGLGKVEKINILDAKRMDSVEFFGITLKEDVKETDFSPYIKLGDHADSSKWWKMVNEFPYFGPSVSKNSSFHGTFVEMRTLIIKWENEGKNEEEIAALIQEKLKNWRLVDSVKY